MYSQVHILMTHYLLSDISTLPCTNCKTHLNYLNLYLLYSNLYPKQSNLAELPEASKITQPFKLPSNLLNYSTHQNELSYSEPTLRQSLYLLAFSNLLIYLCWKHIIQVDRLRYKQSFKVTVHHFSKIGGCLNGH